MVNVVTLTLAALNKRCRDRQRLLTGLRRTREQRFYSGTRQAGGLRQTGARPTLLRVPMAPRLRAFKRLGPKG
jgi:hypothetical protein